MYGTLDFVPSFALLMERLGLITNVFLEPCKLDRTSKRMVYAETMYNGDLKPMIPTASSSLHAIQKQKQDIIRLIKSLFFGPIHILEYIQQVTYVT